jgi:UDP-N-acetylglucosamine 2-epimerase
MVLEIDVVEVRGKVFVTGNTIVDAVYQNLKLAEAAWGKCSLSVWVLLMGIIFGDGRAGERVVGILEERFF